MSHPLHGSVLDVAKAGLTADMMAWIEELEDEVERDGHEARWESRAAINDPELAAYEFMRLKKEHGMPVKVKTKRESVQAVTGRLDLPSGRSEPTSDLWNYAYLLTGEKKIGKTKFAIEGCEELVLQFDKPQLAYSIREIMIKRWADFKDVLKQLEQRADNMDFPYRRVVVDGAGEWYQMCQIATCKKFGVEHPSEEGYARAWHHLRDEFNDAVNRLMRLQNSVGCGLVFIAHSEWKEKKTRSGEKIERLVPNLPPRAEEILNGKCDAWFTMDYDGKDRIIVLLGDETTGAGHRIDGHFLTPDGRRVEEVHMGSSSEDALKNFTMAFNNEWPWATNKERRSAERQQSQQPARKIVRKK